MSVKPTIPREFSLQERLVAADERRLLKRSFIRRRHHLSLVLLLAVFGLLALASAAAFRVALALSDRSAARYAGLTITDLLAGPEADARRLAYQRESELEMFALAGKAGAVSFDPSEVEGVLREAESKLPRQLALRLADAVEAAGQAAPGNDRRGESLAELGRQSRSRQLSNLFRRRLRRVYFHVPEGALAGAAPAVLAAFKRRGYRIWTVGSDSLPAAKGRLVVRYAFNDRAIASSAAHDMNVALRRTMGVKRPELMIQRTRDADLFGGRAGAMEMWLPAP